MPYVEAYPHGPGEEDGIKLAGKGSVFNVLIFFSDTRIVHNVFSEMLRGSTRVEKQKRNAVA